MPALQTTQQFLASLGVNVHVEYNDGKYADVDRVVGGLAYLGISNVRDATLNPYNQAQWAYDYLASFGIKFNLFFQGTDLPLSIRLVEEFLQRHPNAVAMIEGPNEVNNFPISFNGLSGNVAAVEYQSALYAAVRASAVLNGVPVANLTSWPDLAGRADYANFHSYPKAGAQPAATLSHDAAAQAAVMPGIPLVMTEGGYYTLPGAGSFGGVDEPTQAKFLLNLFFDNAKSGVVRSYVYELLDAYADPTGTDQEKHFGLFRLDGSAKPAATAIHNMTSILSDASSLTPTPLDYTLSGLPETGSSLLLTASATKHDLVLWNEPQIWDSFVAKAVTAPATQTGVGFASLMDVALFDPLVSDRPLVSYKAIRDLRVILTDRPIILEVTQSQPGLAAADTVVLDYADRVVGATINGAALSSSSGAVTEDGVLIRNAQSLVFSGGSGQDNVIGSSGNDSLSGGLGDDWLEGELGDDVLDGGGGLNTVAYQHATSGVVVDLSVLVPQDTVSAGVDLLINIQNVTGSSYADSLTGDGQANVIYGGYGADLISGGAGADVIYGNQGDDVIYGNQDSDWIHGGQGSDVLYGGKGDDTINGGIGDDQLFGNLGDDTFVISSSSGRDTIRDFGLGNDVIHFAGGQFANFQTMFANAAQTAAGVLITVSPADQVLLAGVLLSDLSGDHFRFG